MTVKAMLRLSQLTVVLALGALPGWAQQQVLVGGGEDGSALITGVSLTVLAKDNTVVIPNTNSAWQCVATCSAEVALSTNFAVQDDGRLTILFDGVPFSTQGRRFELNDNSGIDDPSPIEVSTTGRSPSLNAGVHSIACAAGKITAADDDFTIVDSSLTYVCSDFSS